MARAKYKKWLEPDNLKRISDWARNGVSEPHIATDKDKMDISYSTLKEWKNKYPAISAALKKNKDIVDAEVEESFTSTMKNIEEESYNVHTIAPTRGELIGAFNKRMFMTSKMGDSFKKYYNIVDALSDETIKTDKSLRTRSGKTLTQAMQEIGRLLHDDDEAEAKEKIAEIKEAIEKAKERIR